MLQSLLMVKKNLLPGIFILFFCLNSFCNSNSRGASADPEAEWIRISNQNSRPELKETISIFSSQLFVVPDERGDFQEPYGFVKNLAVQFARESQEFLIGIFKLLEQEPMELVFLGRDTVHLLDLFESIGLAYEVPWNLKKIGVSGDSFTNRQLGPRGAGEFIKQLGFDYSNIKSQKPWLIFELASRLSTPEAQWLRQPRFMLTGLVLNALEAQLPPEEIYQIIDKFRVIGLLENRALENGASYAINAPELNSELEAFKGRKAWENSAQSVLKILKNSSPKNFREVEFYNRIWKAFQFPHLVPHSKIFQTAQTRPEILWHEKYGVMQKDSSGKIFVPEGHLIPEREITIPFQIYLYEYIQSEEFKKSFQKIAKRENFNLNSFFQSQRNIAPKPLIPKLDARLASTRKENPEITIKAKNVACMRSFTH